MFLKYVVLQLNIVSKRKTIAKNIYSNQNFYFFTLQQ